MNGSSIITRPITTNTAVTPGWPELPRLNAVAHPHTQSQTLSHIAGDNTATAYFRPPLPPELEFDTHKVRTHLSLRKNAPDFRHPQKLGPIASISILGGLHHQYVRV